MKNDNTENSETTLPDATRAARHGKIARLSKPLRHELNLRLEDREPTQDILRWLNELPEVKTMLAAEFGGRPIRSQNLSEWRKGGYRDWLQQQEAFALVQTINGDAAELQSGADGALGDKLATWLMARYFVAARFVTDENGCMDWKVLRELTRDVSTLRRGDMWSQRAQLEKEKFAYQQTRDGRDMEKQFWEWVAEPEICEKITKDYSGQSDRAAWAGYQMFGEFWDGPMPPGAAPLTEKQAAKVVESARARVKFTAEAAERAIAELEAVLAQVRFEPEQEAVNSELGTGNAESPEGNIQPPTADTEEETPNTKIQTPKNSQPANAERGTGNSEPETGNLELGTDHPKANGKTSTSKTRQHDDRKTPGESGSIRVNPSESGLSSDSTRPKPPVSGKPVIPPGHYSPPKPLSPDGEDL